MIVNLFIESTEDFIEHTIEKDKYSSWHCHIARLNSVW